jgi:transposase
MKKLNELKRLKTYNFIDYSVPIIDMLCPVGGRYFDNEYCLICLVDFVDRGVSWRKYKGTHEYPIEGVYLNKIHNMYIRAGVYDAIDEAVTKKYLKTDRECKLKNQIIDSSFIQNKQGSVKNNNHLLTDWEKQKNEKIRTDNETVPVKDHKKERTFVDFNRYNGRKKYIKTDIISDTYGFVLAHSLSSAKLRDSQTLVDLVEKLPKEINTLKNSKVNRYKQNFLADSGYDSKRNLACLKKKGYNALIKHNRRNTKNKEIIKKRKFNAKQKKIYKRRYVVEVSFAWLKNKPVININYQKTIESYNGLFTLACAINNSKRI